MPKKVLIADDEPNIVMSLEFLMRQGGYEVRTVTDGEKAREVLAAFRPDLILLDVMMPRKNGNELCQYIRGTPGLEHIKVVMLTAKGRETDVVKGLGVGADRYVTKPFATKDLVATVKVMLGE